MAKRLHYDRLVINSKNKVETAWNIVKSIRKLKLMAVGDPPC
jgi:hypothetical protein